MKPYHPFVWLSEKAQTRAFVALLFAVIAVMMSLKSIDQPLITEAAPHGIVSLELAGDLENARSMIRSWGPRGQIYAGLSLGFDYLFIVVYASCIALACVLIARRLHQRLPQLAFMGMILAWIPFLAALLDAAENFGLIRVLLGSDQNLWPFLARWCAISKFLIVLLALVYVVCGLFLILWVKKSRPIQKAAS